MTDTIESASSARSGGSISALPKPELQALAAQLGITGTSRMRKDALVEAIQSRSGGGTGQSRSKKTTAEQPTEAPARSRRATRPAEAPADSQDGQSADGRPSRSTGAAADERAARGARATRATRAEGSDTTEDTGSRGRTARAARGGKADRATTDGASGTQEVLADLEAALDRQQSHQGQSDAPGATRGDEGGERRSRRAGRTAGAPVIDVDLPEGPTGGERRERQDKNQDGQRQQRQGNAGQQNGQNRADDDDERGGRRRRSRDRYRDRNKRNRRGGQDSSYEEIELTEDDVLVPVAGILDVLENYAFVRTSGYLPGSGDVYVPLAQVRKAGLRRGDAITGAVRAPREGESVPQQQGNRPNKANALVRLDTINGMSPDLARQRPEFSKLTPLYPQDRLRLEHDASHITPRVIDIVAPIGKGQRGLIVAPPKAGKTIIMQQIANAITANNPEVHLMVVLVDERPEEVTDMERTVKGEVIASTFDRPASDHTMVAELAIERAKRLVELGQDVVVLLDSLTRLSRAYNLAAPASGRILSGGVDASALYPPKRFFGAARNIENGGSLTILASALVETGSKMDEVIFEEFKGTGNMELRLSRSLADKRIFPAVDVNASGTRREEILIAPDELKIVWKLRRVMGSLDQQQAIELLLGKLRETKSNVEFLLQVQKTTPSVHGKTED
ncbi:transcription termination factor Rho [Cellulomonas sp. NPDC089187]|uniref:transcription termination factor Rho n=1 Tax=Cellulomonas sp. NPDC089187 TaxID=3154970 RepID=UPI003429C8EE